MCSFKVGDLEAARADQKTQLDAATACRLGPFCVVTCQHGLRFELHKAGIRPEFPGLASHTNLIVRNGLPTQSDSGREFVCWVIPLELSDDEYSIFE